LKELGSFADERSREAGPFLGGQCAALSAAPGNLDLRRCGRR
jgi:hypothetical protein